MVCRRIGKTEVRSWMTWWRRVVRWCCHVLRSIKTRGEAEAIRSSIFVSAASRREKERGYGRLGGQIGRPLAAISKAIQSTVILSEEFVDTPNSIIDLEAQSVVDNTM